MKVRSLTFHVPIRFLKDFSIKVPIIRDVVKDVSMKHGLDVWSFRLAVDPQRLRDLFNFIDFIDDISDIFDYYAIPIKIDETAEIDLIVNLLRDYEKLFLSLSGGFNEFLFFRDILFKVKDKLCLESFVKLSFTFGGYLLTPYFPSASAGDSIIISASMLYVDALIDAVKHGISLSEAILNCVKHVKSFLIDVADQLSVRSIGLDLSISPWMNESVVDLIEVFGGISFGGIGTRSSIYGINECLRFASSREHSSIGFNELMLPYAEDSKLMILGGEGLLSAYDLLSLSSVCVAGFDMVVLPNMDKAPLDLFLRDVYSVLSVKGRPCGVRVILSDGVYGDVADLGFIGKAPVLKLF
ncbi:MAG: DUF711 family protein [Candidatus Methanomethylicia archaeon]